MVFIYKKSGVKLDIGKDFLIMDDIEDWLFDDFGAYYFTKLCELISEIYHGIMRYIYPIKQTNIKYPDTEFDEGFYRYDIPVSLTEDESKFEFYELLNRNRNIWMPKIKSSECLDDDDVFINQVVDE